MVFFSITVALQTSERRVEKFKNDEKPVERRERSFGGRVGHGERGQVPRRLVPADDWSALLRRSVAARDQGVEPRCPGSSVHAERQAVVLVAARARKGERLAERVFKYRNT